MDSKTVSASIASFAVKFCNKLEKSRSVVSSPLSAEFLLALLALGSTDPAHSELLTAIGIPDDKTIRSVFTSVSTKIRQVKGVTLNIANRVYVKQGSYELAPLLLEDATKVFDAGIEKVDFSQSAAAAQLINTWVASKTKNKIKDFLSSDSLNNETRLVLVNALYFKGTWKMPFDPQHTKPQDFHVDSKTTIQLPRMYKEADYKHGESKALNAQLLEMHYVGDEASMVIILPREIEGLNSVLEQLANGHDLMSELKNMSSTKVQVSLPKFKIETEIDLNSLLPKLGIKAIFSKGNSGLDKLLNPPGLLYVSKAIQKAYIKVNEEGAEAAAATAGMVTKLRAGPPPTAFVCDRPFLYILTGAENNTLFIGVYRGN